MSNQNLPAQQAGTAPATQEQSPSERFTNMVMREFSSTAGSLQMTNLQKKLVQNYFIKLDMSLKAAELKRTAVPEDKRKEQTPYVWQNVNMQQLALDVIATSAIGLDPLQKNHINLIPYKNNRTGKYDITMIVGYNGEELKAKKYGFEPPNNVIIELVFKNDRFKMYKKDKNNKVETYEFEVLDAFDRGPLVGGFYYHEYFDQPERNKVEEFTIADIEKRKPKYASADFWGGEKAVYENGKKVGTEKTDGWYEEMCWKTIKRAAYSAIPIDSEKIDSYLAQVMQIESNEPAMPEGGAAAVKTEIKENANKKTIQFDDAIVVDDKTPAGGNGGANENSTSNDPEAGNSQGNENSSQPRLSF